jgi:hypothetical protein
MKYLVSATAGPGFSSPEEARHILESVILPSFDALMKLERQKKIVAGGLPLGDRAFVFIMEAKSNEDVDQTLREIPMWGMVDWEVVALQSFKGRADQERQIVKKMKGRR